MIMLTFGVAAVVLPGFILRVRRTAATYALVGMIWFVLAAGVLAVYNDIREDQLKLDLLDGLRLGAVACFLVFLLKYDRRPG